MFLKRFQRFCACTGEFDGFLLTQAVLFEVHTREELESMSQAELDKLKRDTADERARLPNAWTPDKASIESREDDFRSRCGTMQVSLGVSDENNLFRLPLNWFAKAGSDES